MAYFARCFHLALPVCLMAASAAAAAERVTLTGKVADAMGQPVDHATVLVWHAGVKHGYSTFCPSCYVDCGKRAMTVNGAYIINGLDPELQFELLIVRDGYIPLFVDQVDPARGPAPDATLIARQPVTDPARVVRGRVVNPAGRPVADAVVEPQGVMFQGPKGVVSVYGTIRGLEPVAVTNADGEFEICFDRDALKMVLLVEARGMAPGLFNTLSTGLDRKTVTVTEGATIRGRVVRDGKPFGGTEIGLVARKRGFGAELKLFGFAYSEIRIGTQPDGSFAITNVPPGVDWFVYGRMGSIPDGAAAPIVECATTGDGEEVQAGDIQVQPGHRLRGRVVLNDGKPIPDGMRVTISSDRAFDSQTTLLPPDGKFNFTGLRSDGYSLFASVQGYRLVSEKGSMDVAVRIDQDVDGFVMTLAPGR